MRRTCPQGGIKLHTFEIITFFIKFTLFKKSSCILHFAYNQKATHNRCNQERIVDVDGEEWYTF